MEKSSHRTIQLSAHKSPSVSKRSHDLLHTRAEIKPITKANYKGLTMSASGSQASQEWNKTYVTTLDMTVEGVNVQDGGPEKLKEYVGTFSLVKPLNTGGIILNRKESTNKNNRNNNSHSYSGLKISTTSSLNGVITDDQGRLTTTNFKHTKTLTPVEEVDCPMLDRTENCSCCSQELFMDNNNSHRYNENDSNIVVDNNNGFMDNYDSEKNQRQLLLQQQPQPPVTDYLDKNLKDNRPLYSFSTTTRGEWNTNVKGPPAFNMNGSSSPQTIQDNKTDKCLSRTSRTLKPVKENGVDKHDDIVIRTNGVDEKIRQQHKGTDNLYITSRLKPLSHLKEHHVKDQDTINRHGQFEKESVQSLSEKPENNGVVVITSEMESGSGDSDKLRNVTIPNFNNTTSVSSKSLTSPLKKKPSLNLVIADPLQQVPSQQIPSHRKMGVQEYHSNMFKLDITKASSRPTNKLTKHLSMQGRDGDLQLSELDSSGPSKRVLHVPLATNVLIPIVLEEPQPPKKINPSTSRKNSATDLEELKDMAKKLNLSTRRPSYLLWKERLHHHELAVAGETRDLSEEVGEDGVDLSLEDKSPAQRQQKAESSRVEAVNQSLAWLRRELGEMRSQDQVLARTLIQIRQDIKELRLQQLCQQHQEILEDARELEEERDIMGGELSCEYIQESFSPTLKQVGVTRMNIGSRRFSVF